MIKIRFPNGQVVQYNDANYLTHGEGGWRIWQKGTDGKEVRVFALIQPAAGVLVEFTSPCAVSNPITGQTPEAALEIVKQHLRTLPVHKVAGLKQQLCAFNARRHTWRA